MMDYKHKHKKYTEFLSKKAKLDWLRDGVENTRVFHQSIKARRIQNQIYNINDKDGV